jgi:phage baseplate assembly protein gpV
MALLVIGQFNATLLGDGSATTIDIDLSQFVVQMPSGPIFVTKANKPVSASIASATINGNPIGTTVTVSGTILTISFSSTPANSVLVQLSINLFFTGN